MKRCTSCKTKKLDKEFKSGHKKVQTCRKCRSRNGFNRYKRAYLKEWEEIMATWEPVIRSQM